MEKKTIRSGAPFLMAGLAVLAYAVIFGVGTLFGYLLEAGIWVLAFAAGKKLFPDRVVEVERAAQSGNAEVDELIAEARTQLAAIRAANDAIAEPELSAKIDGIESTCRQILARLEEQPQMLSSLRTFLRYYLPATMKLLDARAKIEGEVRMGANAQIAQRIREAMEVGVLAGFQTVDIKATLLDGSYHEVDSSEMAFKIAGALAFKEAAVKASPVLLEPIFKLEVVVPDEYLGDVIGDLNSRRGRIEGVEMRGNAQVVNGLVPLSQTFGYATDLRSKTQGRGVHTMQFAHYEQVPESVAQEVISKYKS